MFGHQGFVDDEYSGTEKLALSKLVESRLVQQNRNGGRHLRLQFGSDPLDSRGVPFGQVFPDVPSKDAYVFIDRVQRLTPPFVCPSVLWCAQGGRSYLLIIETIEAWEEILVVGVGDDVIHHPIKVGGMILDHQWIPKIIRLDRVALPVHRPGVFHGHTPVPPRSKNSQARSELCHT